MEACPLCFILEVNMDKEEVKLEEKSNNSYEEDFSFGCAFVIVVAMILMFLHVNLDKIIVLFKG